MSDRELLVAFCEWFMRHQRRNTRLWKTREEIDARECPNQHDVVTFLATRDPQDEPPEPSDHNDCAIDGMACCSSCPVTPPSRSRPARSTRVAGPPRPADLTPLCDDCVLTADECPTCARKPPAPQRYWRVIGGDGAWWANTVNARGEVDGPWLTFGGGRATRAAAERDGIASGLPQWPGAGGTR